MNKKILLVVLVIAQLVVPSMIIASQERILTKGDLVKFKTEPVDPYDIFRGRYVALSTDQRSIDVRSVDLFRRGQALYVILGKDDEGFAKVIDARLTKPAHNQYIKTKVTYAYDGTVNFNLPLNRYYMNEEKAPKAEALYREHSQNDKHDAHINVRILDGKALIEGLYLENMPMESYFE